jgi:hypothetical protein
MLLVELLLAIALLSPGVMAQADSAKPAKSRPVPSTSKPAPVPALAPRPKVEPKTPTPSKTLPVGEPKLKRRKPPV